MNLYELNSEGLNVLVTKIRQGYYGFSLASIHRNLKASNIPHDLARAAIAQSGIFSFMLHQLQK
ncbi:MULTISPECIES: hypothetical protein [Trichocoleus]|uniref:Uncharacterized protein n=1 Tax=Trichocoleus desertorum GB2-A4 TaxID=2933944 RepID=A0ABV0JCZ2_9CYAN|nr:hypothetical protein [Trichocoleus sp. FACHB-46]MBD1864301.1 hypothetical protein [Trichocoleus sp. FACHB-46]